MVTREVVTYHLEMTAPEALRSAHGGAELSVVRATVPSPEFSRFLYTAVGGPWYWTERLDWSFERWRQHLERPELETWAGYVEGTPAGFFELERQPEGNIQILYFGLLPAFIGRGLGGRLLTEAVRRAWALEARRVWVHTCTLDGPAALHNYLARGFRIFREERATRELPPEPPGPWG